VAIADSAHVELREVGPKEVGGVGEIFRIPFKALSMNGKATEPPEATVTVQCAP
jgi:hypothetical protein